MFQTQRVKVRSRGKTQVNVKSSIIVNNGSENLELWEEEEIRRERIVIGTWYTTIVASPCTIQLAVPLSFVKTPFKGIAKPLQLHI